MGEIQSTHQQKNNLTMYSNQEGEVNSSMDSQPDYCQIDFQVKPLFNTETKPCDNMTDKSNLSPRYCSSDSDDSAIGGSVTSAADVDTSHSNISSDVDEEDGDSNPHVTMFTDSNYDQEDEDDSLLSTDIYLDLTDIVRTQNGIQLEYAYDYPPYEYSSSSYHGDASKQVTNDNQYYSLPDRQMSLDEITLHGDVPSYEYQISTESADCDAESDIENEGEQGEKDNKDDSIECINNNKIPWHRSCSEVINSDDGGEVEEDDPTNPNNETQSKSQKESDAEDSDDSDEEDTSENKVQKSESDASSDNEDSDADEENDVDQIDDVDDIKQNVVVDQEKENAKEQDGTKDDYSSDEENEDGKETDDEGGWVSNDDATEIIGPEYFKKSTVYQRKVKPVHTEDTDSDKGEDDDDDMETYFGFLNNDSDNEEKKPKYDSDSDFDKSDELFGFLNFFNMSSGSKYAFPTKMPATIKEAVRFWELDFQVGNRIFPRMGCWEEKGLAPDKTTNPADYKTYLGLKSLYHKWLQCNKSLDAWYRKYAGKTLREIASFKSRSQKHRSSIGYDINQSGRSISDSPDLEIIDQSEQVLVSHVQHGFRPVSVEAVYDDNEMTDVPKASNKQCNRGSALDADDDEDGPCMFDMFDAII